VAIWRGVDGREVGGDMVGEGLGVGHGGRRGEGWRGWRGGRGGRAEERRSGGEVRELGRCTGEREGGGEGGKSRGRGTYLS
jgi:hypothetical protein